MSEAEKLLADIGSLLKEQTDTTKELIGMLGAAFGLLPAGATSISPSGGIKNRTLGQLVPGEGIKVTEDWQIYLFTGTLAAGAPGIGLPLIATVDASFHFDMVKINHVATSNLFDMRIFDGDSTRSLSNNWIPATCHSSATMGLPYMLLGKRRFMARQTITIEARDQSGAPNLVNIVLHGIRVYV